MGALWYTFMVKIPDQVTRIGEILERAGYEAYLVGGCVRDVLRGVAPKDWDIATNARPEEVQKLFPDSVYENQFGTVGVKLRDGAEGAVEIVEITTYRIEGKYTDKRHPDEVRFAKTIEEDLSRRDFTVNALALRIVEGVAKKNIVDPFGGQEDLKKEIVRAVGNPDERFTEDALRLMRAVRFAVQLGFEIEGTTMEAARRHAKLLNVIALERIRDELQKIIMTDDAMRGIQILEDVGLLQFIFPELREGIEMGQNLHHIYTVWEHNLKSLEYTVKKHYSFEVRMAALLHDVGKSRTKRGEGKYSTFYGHEVVGGRMARTMLERLHFSREFVERVSHLVRCHLFYYNVGEVTEAGVRRFLRRVGPENIDDLIQVREADRIGSGVPKAVPYKLRHLLFMIEKVKRDPISPKMLKIDGGEVMTILGIAPGPKVGHVLNALMEEVIEDPSRNTEEYLVDRIKYLGELGEQELVALAQKGKEAKDGFERGVEEEMKKEFYVK